ncbi:MAG TPA: DUF1573 domain-containing protein [Candidatus Kapabacteria bacterium]|jgi:hypothetical protein|nr:DUF1573 domain-containing protein [Candidatus Kapabacteria bacterium]HOM05183.1 DUF1573 domain-containing protein [Candidatus Kapabacteria bacterium]HOQ49754.1 DUF1573 domain-containing protein [Candidatus Kapabacteria bacterium]HPP38940.1 DUF1573 domain-containing protein [Candidatus Kapabacteria bacterium]HPU24391.1 DUF1573 domain-containing protein [Candidatus Kapabacteria bacterium]
MKRWFALLLLFFTALQVYSQPKIEFVGGETIDWKDVSPKDNPLHSEVIIKNAGTEKLVIKEVKPTCGCTTAPLDKYELEPGETTKMKVTLNLGSSSGKVHKTIRVTSNDPNAQTKIISLRANVIRPIEIKPANYIVFDNPKVGVESTAKFFIKNNTNKPITISDFKTEPRILKINLVGEKQIQPNEEIEIIARIIPDKTGYLNAYIKMKTTEPDTPEVEIRCYGNVTESPIFNSK